MSDPFDFSDFGPARTPVGIHPAATSTSGVDRLAGPDTLPSKGFDPFAVSPATHAQLRQAVAQNAPASDRGLQVARPPLLLLALALALAVAGIVITAVWGHALPTAATGWFVAGPVAIGALSAYSRVDTRRRADAVYSAPAWTGVAYWAVTSACLAGIGLSAWYLALWAGGQ